MLCSLRGQPEAVNNLPAVASKTQLMGLMNQGTITLAKSCLAITEGEGIRVVILDKHTGLKPFYKKQKEDGLCGFNMATSVKYRHHFQYAFSSKVCMQCARIKSGDRFDLGNRKMVNKETNKALKQRTESSLCGTPPHIYRQEQTRKNVLLAVAILLCLERDSDLISAFICATHKNPHCVLTTS